MVPIEHAGVFPALAPHGDHRELSTRDCKFAVEDPEVVWDADRKQLTNWHCLLFKLQQALQRYLDVEAVAHIELLIFGAMGARNIAPM